MKSISIVAGLLFFIFIWFIIFHGEMYASQVDRSVGKVLNNATKVIQKKYKIKASGTGISMPDGIVGHLGLAFTTKSSLSKNELRKLLVGGGQELLKQINDNKDIQPFLKTAPFTIKNVEIIIYNHDKDGRGLRDPEISTAEISDGILTYRTINPDNHFQYKNEFRETYEEALEALQNQ